MRRKLQEHYENIEKCKRKLTEGQDSGFAGLKKRENDLCRTVGWMR
jgi:hypothetical protein